MQAVVKVLAVGVAGLLLASSSGCAVVAVADAAITVGAVAVKTTAKVVGKAVDMVLPD